MLSRIADSLFWLNRYMERADGLLLVTKTIYILSLDKGVNNNLTWRPVIETFTHAEEDKIALLENNTDASLNLLLADTTNLNSLKILLTRARENARGVQDYITKEVWEQVNQMYHLVNNPNLPNKLTSYSALETIENFLRNSLLYTGVTDITMPRGTGWSFMNLGRYIERCLLTLETTDKQYADIQYNIAQQNDILQWRYLLLSLSGYELHLKTYRTNNYNKNVLHQVLINENFPHSVLYSLSRIGKYLETVVSENKTPDNEALLRLFGRLYSRVKYVDFDSLNSSTLQQFLTEVRYELFEFSKQVAHNFFSYS
ncbi:alpha-E domain-containing protein [Foetidibacter luteolus]|uniref:alpha-E domain-containing protein n=1 Tax=Foetidibacter luteolus TaxID=2608880 RepID=UPI00129B578F|nr:alpha-E domain-containing protein [Foetidibacter luteolus]